MTDFQTPRSNPGRQEESVSDPGDAASLKGESIGGAEPVEGLTSGRFVPERVRRLVAGLQDPDAGVRADSALVLVDALKGTGPGAQTESAQPLAALHGLAEALKGGDRDVRLVSVVVLGRVGPAAKEAVPALSEALQNDEYSAVREAAARALGRIGGEGAVFGLVGALRDGAPEVRRASAGALGMIGPEAKAAGPALAEALNDSSLWVRVAAEEALRLMFHSP